MIRLRRQYNLATLMAVVLALGVNFAWVPWPGSGVLAILIVISAVVSGFRLIEWLVIYGIVGVLLGLLIPAVPAHHPTRTATTISTTPAPVAPYGGPPSPQSAEEPNE
jgi:hypothetical protein